MAEEYINQGGVCSGSQYWWNPSRTGLFAGGLSPCSGAAGDPTSFGWPAESNSDWNHALLFGGVANNGIRASNNTPSNFNFNSNSNNIMHESGSSDSSCDWTSGLVGKFASEDHDDYSNQTSENNYASRDFSSSCGYPSTMDIKSFLLNQPPPSLGNQSNLPAVDYSSQMVPSYGSSFSDDSSPTKSITSSITNPPNPNRLHFSNDTPYWNASMSVLDDIRVSLLGPKRSTLDEKPNRPNLITKASSQYSQVSGSVDKRASPEPAFKRPRIETPSPLPTFKVRKEKLGDRITALQQLVSPFGKTDTASVLHEAIDYIKFLHDQVSALSTPYMKSGGPLQHHQVSSNNKVLKDANRPQTDLRSRGLCLVPISSTFPIATETPSDFWTPTFGGSFR